MVIGLMGGIGSGKSTVLNYLESHYNAFIIQSDHVAKEIMTPGHEVFDKVSLTFPEVIVNDVIDSEKLSKIVFGNKDKLKELNAITHPGTVKEIISQIKKSSVEITVVESALLIGSGLEKYIDDMWFVYCERGKRIQRLISDRGYSFEKAVNIINNQPSDEEYNRYADEFIDNSDTQHKTFEQIDLILRKDIC